FNHREFFVIVRFVISKNKNHITFVDKRNVVSVILCNTEKIRMLNMKNFDLVSFSIKIFTKVSAIYNKNRKKPIIPRDIMISI
ncbi:hypothetical protein, partial [Vibrio cholerae]|uniref:hypothetical protein n=1 Tax=Vibrio cholerae TaxID=666 RepID=UPI001F37147B